MGELSLTPTAATPGRAGPAPSLGDTIQATLWADVWLSQPCRITGELSELLVFHVMVWEVESCPQPLPLTLYHLRQVREMTLSLISYSTHKMSPVPYLQTGR